MVGPSVKVVKVPLETGSTLGLNITRLDALLVVESITVVPCRSMGRPVGHADPTELVCEASALFGHSKRVLTSTLFARHMIATAILLNRRVALGALFRIRHQPVGRLGIVGALLFP